MRPYVPDAEEVRQLRQLSRQLDSLKTQLQGQKNARDQLPKTSAAHASKERHIAFLEEEIARVKQEADKHIASSQELKKTHKLLLTIPGVGKELARTTLAELGDVGRFKHAKDKLYSAYPYHLALAVVELSPVLLLVSNHPFEEFTRLPS